MDIKLIKHKIYKYNKKNDIEKKDKYTDKLNYYKNKLNKINTNNLMKGGESKIIKLSGPVSAYYYINKKLNKKVIVLGDHHASRDGKCYDNDYNIIDYIKNLKTIGIDLFIENDKDNDIHIKTDNKDNNKDDEDDDKDNNRENYMFDFIKFAENEHKNIRFHKTDIRSDNSYIAKAMDDFVKKYTTVEFLLSIKPPKNMDVYEYTNYVKELIFFDLLTFMFLNQKTLLDIVDNNLDKIDINNLDKYVSKSLIKEFMQLDKITKENLFNVFNKEFQKFADRFFDQNFIFSDNFNLESLYLFGQYSSAAFSDLYLVSRMLKNDDFINNIFYVGDDHIENIGKYLKSVGFELVNKIKVDFNNKQYQCIKINDFDLFFNDYNVLDEKSDEYKKKQDNYLIKRKLNDITNKLKLNFKTNIYNLSNNLIYDKLNNITKQINNINNLCYDDKIVLQLEKDLNKIYDEYSNNYQSVLSKLDLLHDKLSKKNCDNL